MDKKYNAIYNLENFSHIDLDIIYKECSGPGGLKLVDFLATKMGIKPHTKLLDAGANRGFPTAYLTKKYQILTVAIDPWNDREDDRPMVEYIKENAQRWGVENNLVAIKTGLPDTHFAKETFDYAYSTTTLEMIRVLKGEAGYIDALKEIFRVLKSGGILGLAEPMHLEVGLPTDLEPYVSQDMFPWKECFKSISHTVKAVKEAGFEIIEADYAPEAQSWWQEYALHDPYCKKKPEEDPKTLEVDNGRWVSFGYIIARKV